MMFRVGNSFAVASQQTCPQRTFRGQFAPGYFRVAYLKLRFLQFFRVNGRAVLAVAKILVDREVDLVAHLLHRAVA